MDIINKEDGKVIALFNDGEKYFFMPTKEGVGIAGKNEARREMINLVLGRLLNKKFDTIQKEILSIYSESYDIDYKNEMQFVVDMNKLTETFILTGIAIKQDMFISQLNQCLENEIFKDEFKFVKE